jgi:hypothetical protein
MQYWWVLDQRPEPKGQQVILIVDRDSAKFVKETGYSVFTWLSEVTFKVLSDPSEDKKRGKETSVRPASSATGEGAGLLLMPPSETPLTGGVAGATNDTEPTNSLAVDEGVMEAPWPW